MPFSEVTFAIVLDNAYRLVASRDFEVGRRVYPRSVTRSFNPFETSRLCLTNWDINLYLCRCDDYLNFQLAFEPVIERVTVRSRRGSTIKIQWGAWSAMRETRFALTMQPRGDTLQEIFSRAARNESLGVSVVYVSRNTLPLRRFRERGRYFI